MAEELAIKGVSGAASHFEYWSLAKNKAKNFGSIAIPTSTRPADKKPEREDFIAFAVAQAEVAISNWILGHTPFTAKLHPEFALYGDYDQLMRLQEWNGRQAIVEDAT